MKLQKHYTHDCEHCQQVGSFARGDQVYDAYVCKAFGGVGEESLIARFGNAEHEYLSMPISCIEPIHQSNPIYQLSIVYNMYKGFKQ